RNAAEPRIIAGQEVGSVPAGVAAALALGNITIEAVAVDIAHEQTIAILLRPVITEVGHQTGMRVSATRLAMDALAAARRGPGTAAPVQVIGGGVDEIIAKAVVVKAIHALVVCAGDHVPEMANDTIDEERLAVLIEVQAPRIGRPVTDCLDDLARR